MRRINSRHTMLMVVALVVLAGCAESGAPESTGSAIEDVEIPAELSEVDSKRALLVESIIRSSPSLAQTSEVFAEVGTGFSRSYLNEIEKVSNYTTLRAQGINLGIYLSDLGYITTYEQSQEVIFYMNCAQKMAEGIGVSDVFDEKTVERMEMNISDKDSIISLISELYWKTDAFLKELNRENISALIICGGWVEGMHIGYRIIQDNPEAKAIYQKVMQQQSNLKKIISLLETFTDDENIEYFRSKLTEIGNDYQAVPKSTSGEITKEQMAAMDVFLQKIETLRNEINQP